MKTNHMKRITLSSFFLISLSLILLPQAAGAQTTKSMTWISVEGNHFVNESGETVVFRGLNVRDPHDLANQGHWKKSHLEEARRWGANVIRLPIHPRSWRERGQAEYIKLLDQGVEWARELGLYLILDWHSIGNLKQDKYGHEMYVTTVAETQAFWHMMSKKYAHEPIVAMYELFNEFPAKSSAICRGINGS